MNTLPSGFIDALVKKIGIDTEIESVLAENGGDINNAFQLKTSNGDYFVKYNSAEKYPEMFNREADALRLIKQFGDIETPNVIATGEYKNKTYLLLNHITSGNRNNNFWTLFGNYLANLHKNTAPEFGLNYNNYIGSLKQSNSQKSTWTQFFIEERLLPQIKLARDNGLAKKELSNNFERFFLQIESIFPTEKPALLHGDLWSGNFLCNKNSNPVLIDPAIYYGHREMDIAMSKLFGGFSSIFYESYNETSPLEKGWQQRIDFCNLYPLLVHLNLFGQGYLSSLLPILKPF